MAARRLEGAEQGAVIAPRADPTRTPLVADAASGTRGQNPFAATLIELRRGVGRRRKR
jgi:hypothetical protein